MGIYCYLFILSTCHSWSQFHSGCFVFLDLKFVEVHNPSNWSWIWLTSQSETICEWDNKLIEHLAFVFLDLFLQIFRPLVRLKTHHKICCWLFNWGGTKVSCCRCFCQCLKPFTVEKRKASLALEIGKIRFLISLKSYVWWVGRFV